MSAKAVEERRLRLIYDALDNYNSKKALQEADKVLKKHPAFTTAKVLRALALIRLERLVEAVNALEEIQANLTDYEDPTLQAFVHCFKELNQPERICGIYEKAVAAKPDEGLYSHLFMSYARVCNFKDQQKTALALFRLVPSQPYYLWAVMSLVMQATENPEMGLKMFLPLAQKMLAKVFDDNGKEWKTAHEIELNIIVMEKQGRLAEAADLLQSDAAANLLSASSAMILIRVLQLRVAAKQWATVMEMSSEALGRVEAVDQWLLWTYLFDATFGLAEECKEEAEKMRFIDRAYDVIKNAVEAAPICRGPYMANLEFVARLKAVGMEEKEKYGDPVDLILSYARRFSARPSCYVDLVKWLASVGERSNEVEAGIAAIVDEVMRKSLENAPKGEDDTDLPTTSSAECWAIVLHERVRRYYGKEMREGEGARRTRVVRLARAHLHSKGVVQPAAALAHLTAEGLYRAYRKDGDARSLYEMLLFLETAGRNWDEDHLTRIVLMHVYTLLGIPSRMRALSEQLDIKMVQRDSLGHIGFHASECGGHIHFGAMHYTSLGEFYDLADREISDCLVTAYKNGAFTQIEGVVGMRRKLRKSIMAVAADVANRWISAAFSLKVIDHVVAIMKGDDDPAEWEALSDNRDYAIFPPADDEMAAEIKDYVGVAREEMMDLSRTRHLIMRLAANVAKGTIEAGRGLHANLMEQLEHCRKTYSEETVPPPSPVNTPPSFIGEWVHGPFLAPVLCLLSSSLDGMEVGGDEKKIGEKLPSEAALTKLFDALVGVVTTSIDNPPTKNTVLPLSTVIRLASRAAHSIALCRQLLRIMQLRLVGPAAAAADKNKKVSPVKESLSCLSEVTTRAADGLWDQLQRLREKIENDMDSFFPTIDEQFWNVEWAALLLSEKREVDTVISKSYMFAITELQGCLKK